MAARVGIQIQQYEVAISAVDDQIAFVVILGRLDAEDATVSLLFRRADVTVTPRAPEPVHDLERKFYGITSDAGGAAAAPPSCE